MKKCLIHILFSLIFISSSLGQEITVSFQPKNDLEKIDSVLVKNLSKNESVKLFAEKSVVFNLVTDINSLTINSKTDGYLYPNPSDKHTNLFFTTKKNEEVHIELFNIAGELLARKTQKLVQGNHSFRLSLPVSGVYYISVRSSDKSMGYKAVYTGDSHQKVNILYSGSDGSRNYSYKENKLKSNQSEKSLTYSNGDVVHYIVYSGNNTTIIADNPDKSKTIEVEFHECKDPDNRNYKVVKIGDQWWMAENLAYLPSVSLPDQGDYNDVNPHFYVLDYQGSDIEEAKKTENYKIYGVLYNWYAATEACPCGWQLPDNADLEKLAEFISINKGPYETGGDGIWEQWWSGVGKHLKTTEGWVNSYRSENGTDDYGFSGFPDGYRSTQSGFVGNKWNINANWWSTTTYNYENLASYWLLSSNSIIRKDTLKTHGFSIRCIKKEAITTVKPTNITSNSAISGGEILNDFGITTARGVVWDTSENPTIEKNIGMTIDEDEDGNYISELQNLIKETTYYVRAYATNPEGTQYGQQIKFTTFGVFTDARDGKNYNTVKISDQEWMAENLAYNVGNGCWMYDYDLNNAEIYGMLYSWEAALNACPDGWHLPSDDEWEQLATYISEQKRSFGKYDDDWDLLGKFLKASGTKEKGNGLWRGDYHPAAIGTNDFGFSALPGGYRKPNGTFLSIGERGYWWGSTENNSTQAWYRHLFYRNLIFYRDNNSKEYGLSVRCVRD